MDWLMLDGALVFCKLTVHIGRFAPNGVGSRSGVEFGLYTKKFFHFHNHESHVQVEVS